MLLFVESAIVYDLKLSYKNLVVIKLKIYVLNYLFIIFIYLKVIETCGLVYPH